MDAYAMKVLSQTIIIITIIIIIIIITVIIIIIIVIIISKFFENRILRRIFGPKRNENGEWRRPHNEELHSLYRSPNILRAIKSKKRIMDRSCSQNGIM